MKAKKKILLGVALLLILFACLACDNSALNGTYKQIELENEIYSFYYSLTLKNGKFELLEVKIVNEEKTVVTICKGQYTFSDQSISFEDSKGQTFLGSAIEGTITFTYNFVEYALTK